jgi:hypothetical protein
VFEEGLGVGDVGGRKLAHGSDVFLDAGLLEAGEVEILRGADEDAGPALDGRAEGGEVAAGDGGEEEDGLLGLVGNGDFDALLVDFLVPGLDADEPVVGRRVGGPAEEGDDEEVANGLSGWEVGMEPEAVAGLKVGDGGDGEGNAGAGDADVDFGADEVESGVLGMGRGRKEGSEEEGERLTIL